MILQSVTGLLFFILTAWFLSENRRDFPVKIVISGMILQLIVGAVMLNSPMFRKIFISLNHIFLSLEESTMAGTSLVFGYLGGASLPFDEKNPGSAFVLAFRSLPIVLVMSALSSLLFYWKILPYTVKIFSKILQKTMGIGGAEGMGVAANMFMGMVEAPLLIRPYLEKVTRSELFTIMTCGMATIAGTVMVLYATILDKIIPNIIGHILTASIISLPAAIVVSKIMIPERDKPTSGDISSPNMNSSSMDALAKGTVQGIDLLINIIAMLIVLVAIVHLVNMTFSILPDISGKPISLQRIMGILMAPVAWLMGIPWSESLTAGSLLGTKTILNEFIAFIELSNLSAGQLSDKNLIIMTYALCGFANPGSLGIMIGGMGAMAPDRRDEITSLGIRSIIAGTISTCMTGAVVGILY